MKVELHQGKPSRLARKREDRSNHESHLPILVASLGNWHRSVIAARGSPLSRHLWFIAVHALDNAGEYGRAGQHASQA